MFLYLQSKIIINNIGTHMTITSNVKLWKNYNSLINQRKDIDSNYTIYNNKIKLNLKSLH